MYQVVEGDVCADFAFPSLGFKLNSPRIDDAAYFARLGLESWGVDISETAVEAAKAVS